MAVETFGQLAEYVVAEKARHEKEWGPNNGLDQTFVQTVDFKVVEKLLTALDKLPALEAWLDKKIGAGVPLNTLDDFVVCVQGVSGLAENLPFAIPKALLVGYSPEKIVWHSDEAGTTRSIDEGLSQGCFIVGISAAAEEELCSKLLSAANLVPYRHGHNLQVDADHDGLYWIKWNDTQPVLVDA